MANPSFILFPGAKAWRIGLSQSDEVTFNDVSIQADALPADIASQIFASLKGAGYAGQGIVLALPSSWCFAASILTGDLPKHDRKAMLFRFEEKLPLAAESVVADFIPSRPAGNATTLPSGALGVCVQSNVVQPLVEALESAGVRVQSISPAALLAVQQALDGRDDYPSLLLYGDGDSEVGQVNVLALEGGTPSRWSLVPADGANVKLQIDLISADCGAPARIEACDLDAGLCSAVSDALNHEITRSDDNIFLAAARFAAKISVGREHPWIEFRRGPLAVRDSLLPHRKPLNFLLASAVALLFVATALMLLRAERYNRISQSAERRMADAFREKFPGWAIPSNVKAVVESELRKSSARAGNSLPADSTRSALQTLRDVLQNLPADKRFTLGRMTILDASFEIEGRLRSYEDVDEIAAAVRKAGLDVPPPQARKDGDGFWSFTLRGTLSVKTSPELAKGGSG